MLRIVKEVARLKRWSVFLTMFFLAGGVLVGSCAQSSSNEDYYVFLPFIAASRGVSVDQYTFFVAGHVYGVPEVDNEGVHPPFKAWFPQIEAGRPAFGVFTGDIVIKGTATNWDEIDNDLDELGVPVRFVVGNHDMTGRALFVERYGPTYYVFEYQNDLFIVLDAELNDGDIVDVQLATLQEIAREDRWHNVFVFVHRPIWVTQDTPYFVLKDRFNNPTNYNFQDNFWEAVEPLLRALDAQVYVIAGDVGVTWAMALFYEEYDNMHLIASGMGGSEEENFLIFRVGATGDVDVQAYRLDGQPLERGRLEAYNLAYYSSLP